MRWWINGMLSGGVPLTNFINDDVFVDAALNTTRTPDPAAPALSHFAPTGRRLYDPASAGWMLVVSDDEEGRQVEKALASLVERRTRVYHARSTPERTPESVVKRYPAGLEGAQIATWVMNELILTNKLGELIAPYYTLIAGDPNKLPFALEYHIHAGGYAAGRLAFPNIDDYRTYAKKVLAWEPDEAPEETSRDESPLGIFATDVGPRDATHQSRKRLVEPMSAFFQGKPMLSSLTSRIADDADRQGLLEMLRGEKGPFTGPRIMFSATHGLAVAGDEPEDVAKRRQDQGGICCQLSRHLDDEILRASNLGDGAFLAGGIWLLFACFGAGTPERSLFYQSRRTERTLLGCHDGKPFLAALPTRLLANPDGPLAVIGHVDPGFVHSFMDPKNEIGTLRQTGLQQSLSFLLRGMRVGEAADNLAQKTMSFSEIVSEMYTKLSNDLSSGRGDISRLAIEEALANPPNAEVRDDRNRLVDAWTAYHDFRNYITLGDPAVRLAPRDFQPPKPVVSVPTPPAPIPPENREQSAEASLPAAIGEAHREGRLVVEEREHLFSEAGIPILEGKTTVISLIAIPCSDVRQREAEPEESTASGGKELRYYEAVEHIDSDLKAQVRLSKTESIPASRVSLTVGNGVTLRYGQAIAMFGDFYGMPNVRIGAGIKQFLQVFATFDKGNRQEMAKILNAINRERTIVDAAVKKTGSASSGYEEKGDELNKLYNRATGGGSIFTDYLPKGRFLELASNNFDHFGADAIAAYKAGHAAACAEARQAAAETSPATQRQRLLRAYLMNACSDHFLTDTFSSGHLRVPRRELTNQIRSTFPSAGDLLSKIMHDEDNTRGLEVRNTRGEVWTAFGDKYFHSTQNQKGRAITHDAVAISAQEVWQAFDAGANPAFEALTYAPDLNEALTNRANHAPMFIVRNGALLIRKQANNPDCYEWTRDMSGATGLLWDFIKKEL
ncbi:MAG TPA: hypothetical protein PK156_17575 [Polyangium sp.]|nr:hypothetical protein [Polyangium sp.]